MARTIQWCQKIIRSLVNAVCSKPNLFGFILAVVVTIPVLEHSRRSAFVSAERDVIADAHAVLRNPLLLFAQRSPGARGAGVMLQTKNGKINKMALASKGVKPYERVLANVRYSPSSLNLANEIMPDISPGLFDSDPSTAPISILPQRFSVPSSPILVTVPGGGGGGGGGGGVIPPAAVPEPSSWITLILGVFLIGRSLRSRQRTVAPS